MILRSVIIDLKVNYTIFPRLDKFSIPFTIFKLINPVIKRITLYNTVKFQPCKTVYTRIKFTILPKKRLFIIITIYLTVINAVINV